MGALLATFATCASVLSGATAAPTKDGNLVTRSLALTVDLGYASYKGYQNSASSLSIWKGYDLPLRRSATSPSIQNLTHDHL